MGWFWILVLLLVAAIIWNVVSSPAESNNLNLPALYKSQLYIIKEQYVRDEIDKEEYEIEKRDLGV
ncbi:hypothetical protein DFO77_102237 [Marinilabilia salmonicolor]|uniref:SHOCT domain-containing protein n=1 Tax=Marinilabilia salmonicolor TaxID=989 RepID=A0A368VD88_9BACT|nr:hypothetical protein DFO77_102237 [Marinilabilia salmonicolor]